MSSLFVTIYLYQKPWSNPWHNLVTFDSAVTGGCGQWGSGHAYKLDLQLETLIQKFNLSHDLV